MKFKEKLTKQLLASYGLLILADLIMSAIYMLVWNYLLTEVIVIQTINIIQAYALFYIARLLFNRNNLDLNVEQRAFDTIKRTFFKAVHYTIWGLILKMLLWF